MRAHYCWHSASFPPPAHKYTQACDKHAHQMHKNKKVWVWSATNRKYGHWYKKKQKKTHAYICRVSERPSDQQAFKNIQQSLKYIWVLLFWNYWSYSELWCLQLILVLHKYPHTVQIMFFPLFFLSFLEQSCTNALLHPVPWFITAFITRGQIF